MLLPDIPIDTQMFPKNPAKPSHLTLFNTDVISKYILTQLLFQSLWQYLFKKKKQQQNQTLKMCAVVS